MYAVRHWFGKQERNLSPEKFPEILSELASADAEHPTVSLEHDSEWVLRYGRTGVLVFENVGEEDAAPRHMSGIAPLQVVELWKQLAAGDLEALERLPWKPGYGS